MVIVEKYLVIKQIEEKWDSLTAKQKLIVREWLSVTNPKNKKNINQFFDKLENKTIKEAWYNTALDVIGIVDPTGIVDSVNGIIYLAKGDYLFGFLSFVSAIPYAGDAVAKPMMAALKVGKPEVKAIQSAMELSKAGKSTEAAEVITKATQTGGLAGWFVNQISKFGPKLKSFVEALPGGVLKGFKNTILEWIELFSKAGKSGLKAREIGQKLATNLPKMSASKQVKNLENFTKQLKSIKGPFSGFDGPVGWKYLWGGMPKIFFGNRASRALAVKTKWYLGLLDYIGIGNWVGPEELENKIGKGNLETKVQEYNNTDQAKQYMNDDFGNSEVKNLTQDSEGPRFQSDNKEVEPDSQSQDPISNIFRTMITGGAGRAALAAL